MAKIAVAPLVGAWIEMDLEVKGSIAAVSLPSWERGLKYSEVDVAAVFTLSLPSWERGLKSI